METTNEKLIQFQTQLAYLERFVEELNQVVIDQSKKIDGLEKQSKQLKDKISQLESDGPPPHEKPPHY